jgi:hypothetical protein
MHPYFIPWSDTVVHMFYGPDGKPSIKAPKGPGSDVY